MFSRGADSLHVPMTLHVENRRRLVDAVRPPSADLLVVKGGFEQPLYDSDTHHEFRQESYFQWLFGVKEPGCFGLIDLRTGISILLVPRLAKEYQAWLGPIKPVDWFKAQYLVDEVKYVDELEIVIGASTCAVIRHVNGDSGLAFEILNLANEVVSASDAISVLLDELRVVKTPEEVKVLTYVNDVSCRSHLKVMHHIFSNTFGKVQHMEHFAESSFKFESALQGCARVGYNCIACSGERNAILHYGHAAEPNNHRVSLKSLRLLDMGAEYHCYTADVTTSFPTSGTFTADQKAIYLCVWEAVLEVEKKLKPGVSYRDMHRYAQRVLLVEMKRRTRLIISDDIEAMIANNLIPRVFMPHGLGHMLGLNVHDVGGYEASDPRDKSDVGLTGLRLGRTLKDGMVLTVEPGIYFIDYLIKEAMTDPILTPYVDWQLCEKMAKSVGGVRIEDDVLITSDGCLVLTDLPRAPDDLERFMQGNLNWEVGKQRRRY
jgi:Xaa-Pro dipeptidase